MWCQPNSLERFRISQIHLYPSIAFGFPKLRSLGLPCFEGFCCFQTQRLQDSQKVTNHFQLIMAQFNTLQLYNCAKAILTRSLDTWLQLLNFSIFAGYPQRVRCSGVLGCSQWDMSSQWIITNAPQMVSHFHSTVFGKLCKIFNTTLRFMLKYSVRKIASSKCFNHGVIMFFDLVYDIWQVRCST